jgi:hypothetical protein
MIGFISTSVTSSLNHAQNRSIADLHTFRFTVAHALGFSVSASRPLATDLNTETSTSNHFKVFLPFLVQSPWNLGTQRKLYYSLLQLTTDCKRSLLSPLNLRRGPTENTSCSRYPLLCDVTAYAEVCLPSRCLETRFITP